MSYTVGTAPGGLPLLGHAPSIAKDPLGFLMSLPDHGDLVKFRLGPTSVYMVCHPKLVHQILVNDRVFDKGGPILDRARDVFGNGLGTCKHQDHRKQRRYIQPAFQRDRFAAYVDVMSEQIDAVTSTWSDGQVIDVPAAMHQFTLSVIVRALFGDTITTLDAADVQQCISDVLSGMTRRIILPFQGLNQLPTRGNQRFNQAFERLKEIADQLIAERHRTGPRPNDSDILSMFVYAEDAGQRMSDTQIRDHVISFFFAGIETTATTLSWAWHFIDQDKNLQDQLHAEATAVLAGNRPRHSDLSTLDLTTRTITEVLRFNPPGWIFTRKTSSRADIAGHTLPAGTTVAYSPYLLGRNPAVYAKPDTFDPERWRHETAKLPRGAVVPFGTGARKCIGDDFAMAMAIVAMATISTQWLLEHLPGASVTPKAHLILAPDALLMRARRPSAVNRSDFSAAPL
ncbi:cytochrome P450 [Streptomyces vinaceus]